MTLSLSLSILSYASNRETPPRTSRLVACRRRSSRACAVEAGSRDDGGETLVVRTDPTSSNAGHWKIESGREVLTCRICQRSVRRWVTWHGFQVLPVEYWAGLRSKHIELTGGRASQAAGCCRARFSGRPGHARLAGSGTCRAYLGAGFGTPAAAMYTP